MQTRRVLVLLPLLLAALAHPVAAHDFWAEPSAWTPAQGERIDVRLYVGDHFVGEEFPRSTRHAVQFVVVDPCGRRYVPRGTHLEKPAGTLPVTDAGTHVVVYRSADSSVELEPARFEAYLRHERREDLLPVHRRLDDATAPVKEVFSRCATAWFRVGPGSRPRRCLRMGLPLEIVPSRDPTCLPTGARLGVTIFYEGTPLAHHPIDLWRGGEAEPTQLTTDAAGRALLPIDATGTYLARCQVLRRLAPGDEAAWRSLWSSMTFRVGPEDPTPTPTPAPAAPHGHP